MAPYLVMGAYDDQAAVNQSMGASPGASFVVDVLVSTPFVLSAINSVIAGAIGALLARQLGVEMLVAIGLGLVGAIVVFGLQVLIASRGIAAAMAQYKPMFPSPQPDEERSATVT